MICYIGIGSNLGDRLGYIKKAIALLKKIPGVRVVKVSLIYETEPKGGPEGQSDYFNLVLEAESQLSPRILLAELKTIEKSLGRKVNAARWGAREIDLDILLYGGQIVHEAGIEVPHPLMHERFFVLKPLNDLAPGLKHPLSGMKVSEMLLSLKKRGRWRRANEEIIP
ncbi:MAG: 2-amino-4-hydroxy-6-hydroxymethyldihydropteridine diphosphokinase [Candidatus Omnitrophica bacterium CG1_02_44_16]|nr:MAG: 2-amino-4-hydroxy-6-hydroxymethyldihydropteridine diphosphokinase [Candidatus Omnitrophica bacterium CG1_02_44_16]PIY82066.1 MAG: 2-amino-4-hydroxy-6-hydroxymethyldihydropteridine diphosphokinase [Candidatus Omnitrophica bacterium CG_4_10_14_0_8_um_filter_44_12]PIZ83136.1 MAG: 2-amino-4-hydroxy-6-hydroxymethyldihydropteridine diphosphokinase [Candidatus Omnitrophica bacterium CG_4_10_14_0_2_um_filter_44_9]